MTKIENIKDRILRLPEVIKITGLSRSTIYAYIKDGIFPKHINLGSRSVGWLLSDINNWLQSRIEQSQSEYRG